MKVDQVKLFGQTLSETWDYVIVSTIPQVFNRLAWLFNRPVSGLNAWYPNFYIKNRNSTFLFIKTYPGSGNCIDPIEFLLMCGTKISNMIFIGFGGALKKEISVGTQAFIDRVDISDAISNTILPNKKIIPIKLQEPILELLKINSFDIPRKTMTCSSFACLAFEDKKSLYNKALQSIDIVDLETGPLYAWCNTRGIWMNSVLVVSDHPYHSMPIWAQNTDNQFVTLSLYYLLDNFYEILISI